MALQCRDDEVMRFSEHTRLPEPPPPGGDTAADLLETPELRALLAQVRRSAPALERILIRLEQLECSGALAQLLELVDVFAALKASTTDLMIHRMGEAVQAGVETVDTLMISGWPQRLPNLVTAADEARIEASAAARPLGLLSLLRSLRQPEVQWTLRFMLGLSRRLPQAVGESPGPERP